MTMQDFFKSKLATLALSAVLAFVLVAVGQLALQKYQINKEIAELKRKASELESNNQELTGLIEYFKTPEYKERQAREQLNLKKEGEEVVVLPDSVREEASQNQAIERTNPEKWYDHFFAAKNQ